MHWPIITVKNSPLNYTFQLSSQNHLLGAIQTTNVDGLGGSDGITTAGADVLSCGTGLDSCGWRGRSVCAGSCDYVAGEFVAVDENVGQIVVQTELDDGSTVSLTKW